MFQHHLAHKPLSRAPIVLPSHLGGPPVKDTIGVVNESYVFDSSSDLESMDVDDPAPMTSNNFNTMDVPTTSSGDLGTSTEEIEMVSKPADIRPINTSVSVSFKTHDFYPERRPGIGPKDIRQDIDRLV